MSIRSTALLTLVVLCPSCLLRNIDDLTNGTNAGVGDADAAAQEAGTDVTLPSDAGSYDQSEVADRDAAATSMTDGGVGDGGSEDISSGDAQDVGPGDASSADALDARGDSSNDASEEVPAPVCAGDLSNIGTSDFRIAFTLTTTATAYSAVLNQRGICNPSTFWDVRLGGSTPGALQAEIDDGTHLVDVGTMTAINDGVAHSVVFRRVSGSLTLEVDGVVGGMTPGTLASTPPFGPMPALRVGTDVCDGMDGTRALSPGMVGGVCISH